MNGLHGSCLWCRLPVSWDSPLRMWVHEDSRSHRCANGSIAVRDTGKEAPPAGSGSPVNGVEEGQPDR